MGKRSGGSKVTRQRDGKVQRRPPPTGRAVLGSSPARSNRLTHVDDHGRAKMVDVSGKPATVRQAIARGEVRMRPETLAQIKANTFKKGDVLAVAKLAGIQAAKRTDELIPLAHPLALTGIDLITTLDDQVSAVMIQAAVSTVAPTGVEMEALAAVAAAALTIYDMCKAVDRSMTIERIRLVRKTGGRSGDYERAGEL